MIAETTAGGAGMTTMRETVAALNELLEASRDGAYGFHACAESARAPRVRTLLGSRAAEWRSSAERLRTQVEELGAAPEPEIDPAGKLRRGWVAPRSVLRERDDAALLAECERGERIALDTYAGALGEELPPGVRRLVEQQYEAVRRNHTVLRRLLVGTKPD